MADVDLGVGESMIDVRRPAIALVDLKRSGAAVVRPNMTKLYPDRSAVLAGYGYGEMGTSTAGLAYGTAV